ncbi:MAG: hypothetical protein E7613_10050 [Ruminococcaceae bacterium]|nr:hypothetical protein [Oscillospiraceae bacterium]
MKRFICTILLLICILSTAVSAEEFKFGDVKESDWFYSDVVSAVEMGLINGKGVGTYCPNDNLTYAEAYKLAACMHQLSTKGYISLKNGNPWYSEYVEYCYLNGIYGELIEELDVNQKITRAGYMSIFAKALPSDMLPIINYIPDGAIPDISDKTTYASSVYKLYRAGIAGGSDAKHNCMPLSNIKRSEVAAILTRMMDKTKRVRFDMGTPEETTPLVITEQPEFIIKDKTITATVKLSGGKEPYHYAWHFCEEGVWYDLKLLASIEHEIASLLEGYESATLTIFGSELGKGSAEFRCTVTDSLGYSITTKNIVLTNSAEEEKKDEEPPAVASDIKVTVSGTEFDYKSGDGVLRIGVEAEGGTKPYRYSWQRLTDGEWKHYAGGSIDPDGTFDPSFDFYDSRIKTPGETFVIKCVVTDNTGATGESDVITITTPDFVIEKGLDQFTDMCVGKEVTLSVKVKGGKEPYTYKWYFGEFVISTKAYSMTPKFGNTSEVTFTMSGKYLPPSDNVKTSFRCDITDANGNTLVTSTGVNDVTPKGMPLTIIEQAKRKTTVPKYGYELEFDIEVYGGKQPYSYEWFYESRYKNNITAISLNTLPQTQVRRFKSELYINLREDTTILGEKIYCVVTDAEGDKVTSEKVEVCPDFFMMVLEDKTETSNGKTTYVGTVKSGKLVPGDKIGFQGYFDGKYEYVTATVEAIQMFGKNLDYAAPGDRVGVVVKNVKVYENLNDLEPLIGNGYKQRNLAFKTLPTVLSVTVSSDRYSTTPGKYVHLNAYATGGSESYKKLEWFKEVDGKWVSLGHIKSGAQKEKGFLMQFVYYGEKEPTSYRAKCIVTDSQGNTAESKIIELVTSDIGFETVFEAETKVPYDETVTFSVKPKGGTAPYTYKWYIHSAKNDNSESTIYFLENDTSCTGYNTDTVTFKVSSQHVSTTGDNGYKRSLGCQITDANGASAAIVTVLKSK